MITPRPSDWYLNVLPGKVIRPAWCLAAFLLLGMSHHFLAADEPPFPAEDLFAMSIDELLQVEVKVASLFNESREDVGSTVAQVKAEDWQQWGARSNTDALRYLPSTMVLPTFFGGDAIAVRGYAQFLSVRGMATLIDGVPVNDLIFGTAQYDRERISLGVLDTVEMIRGPGSSIYGTDAFHGVLSLRTFEAFHDSLSGAAETGQDGYYAGHVKASQALGENIRADLAMDFRGQGDQARRYRYTDNETGEARSGRRSHEYDTQSWVLTLHNQPDADLAFSWSVYGNEFRGEGFPGLGNLFGPTRNVLEDEDVSRSDSDFLMTRLAVSKSLPHDLRAEIQGYFWDMNRESAFRQAANVAVLDQGQEKYGVEARLKQQECKWNTQWVAAVGYSRDDIVKADSILENFAGVIEQAGPSPYHGLDREVVSAFLQARTELWQKQVALLYGGRLDDYSDFGTQETPRLGLVYRPVHDTSIKALYGNAFRAPIALEVTNSPNIKGSSSIHPEELDSYELVLQQHGEKWQAEVVLFYNEWKDGILVGPTTDPDFSGEYRNIGENESRGIECSGTYLSAPWYWQAGASYVESENIVDDIDYVAFPEWIVTLGTGYKVEPWDLEIFVGNRIHLDTRAGPITSFIPDPETLATYWRCDLSLTKTVRNQMQVFANVHNLFDRDNTLPAITGAEGGIPDEPLNVSLGVRHRF